VRGVPACPWSAAGSYPQPGVLLGVATAAVESYPHMLTEIAIRKARTPTKPTKLSDERGLYLLCAPSGGKWWRFKFLACDQPFASRSHCTFWRPSQRMKRAESASAQRLPYQPPRRAGGSSVALSPPKPSPTPGQSDPPTLRKPTRRRWPSFGTFRKAASQR
jgi:hypothetical protein